MQHCARRLVSIAVVLILGWFLSVAPASAGLYRPPSPYELWDTWLFKDGQEYHLFFMQNPEGASENDWYTFGRAVSTDLLHWRPLPAIPVRGTENAWDNYPIMTGTTVKAGDRYALFYNSYAGNCQIGVMFSPDLKTWEKYPGNPVIVSKGPHYGGKDWRDLCLTYDSHNAVWHGFVCAQTGDEKPVPCIGHVTSKDLLHWDYQPSAFSSPDFADMEAPDYFELNDRHYLIFSSVRSRKDMPDRKDASGCYYVISDHRDGPYRIPERPLLLGAGRGRFDNYCARTFPLGDTRLLYYQTYGRPVVWGAVKRVRQHPDGTLWLQYWPGLDKLETRTLFDDLKKLPQPETSDGNTWSIKDNIAYGEASSSKAATLWLPINAEDMMITLKINPDKARRAGVVWRWNGRKGAGVILNRAENTVSVMDAATGDNGLMTPLLDDIAGKLFSESPQHLRIFVRAHRAEIYMNDCWLFGVSLNDVSGAGKVGLLVEDGAAAFSEIRVAELEPLARPAAPANVQ
jgi:beta-fructofuranosidase